MPLDSGGMEQHAQIRIPRRRLCGAKRIRRTSRNINLLFPSSFVDTPASISSSNVTPAACLHQSQIRYSGWDAAVSPVSWESLMSSPDCRACLKAHQDGPSYVAGSSQMREGCEAPW